MSFKSFMNYISLFYFFKKKLFSSNNNKINFFYNDKNLLKSSVKLNFLMNFYYYIMNNNLNNLSYVNKIFKDYSSSNFLKYYEIYNNFNFIELYKFNLFTNFFKFFKFGKPYIHLFYYSKEKVSSVSKSDMLDMKWSTNAGKYMISDELQYTKWNMLNNNIIFFNFNYLFFNNYLFLIFFNKFNNNLFKKKFSKLLLKKKKLIWLNCILNYKFFLKVFYQKKLMFLKDFSKLFWKKTLKYWFEYFMLMKNDSSLFSFFKFFKISPFFFMIVLSTILNSKFLVNFNFNKLMLKTFDEIFDALLVFFFKNNFFKKFFNFFFILFMSSWIIFNMSHYVAMDKMFFSIYGVFQHLASLQIYFYNLLNDTTLIDIWLKNNNLCGVKLSLLFTKVLFILNWKLNIKSSPWHSFYLSFFDLLKMIKLELLKKNNKFYKILKVFYSIFFKLMFFIKENKLNLSKKSFSLKPISYGVSLYM